MASLYVLASWPQVLITPLQTYLSHFQFTEAQQATSKALVLANIGVDDVMDPLYLGSRSRALPMHLPARNGLVNEAEFLGLITQKW